MCLREEGGGQKLEYGLQIHLGMCDGVLNGASEAGAYNRTGGCWI